MQVVVSSFFMLLDTVYALLWTGTHVKNKEQKRDNL